MRKPMKLSDEILELITDFPGIVGVYRKKIEAAAERAAKLEKELTACRRALWHEIAKSLTECTSVEAIHRMAKDSEAAYGSADG